MPSRRVRASKKVSPQKKLGTQKTGSKKPPTKIFGTGKAKGKTSNSKAANGSTPKAASLPRPNKPARKTVQNKPTPRRKKSSPIPTRTLTPAQIARLLSVQQTQAQATAAAAGRAQASKQAKLRATKAFKAFKPKKTDRGKLIFISSGGKRNPHHHGKVKSKTSKGKVYDRRGYLIYVGKTGKKQLIRQHRHGYKATSFSNLQPPLASKFSKSRQKIYAARVAKNQSGKPIILGRGQIVPKSKGASFTDAVVEKFSEAIEKQLEKVRGQKRFNIKILVKLKGIAEPISVFVPIDRPDHAAIEKGGIENFVRQKLYAHLSSDLAAQGLVTAGSANHIRKLSWNEGLPQEEWQFKPGLAWDRRDCDIVQVEVFEWLFEAVKYTKGK